MGSSASISTQVTHEIQHQCKQISLSHIDRVEDKSVKADSLRSKKNVKQSSKSLHFDLSGLSIRSIDEDEVELGPDSTPLLGSMDGFDTSSKRGFSGSKYSSSNLFKIG